MPEIGIPEFGLARSIKRWADKLTHGEEVQQRISYLDSSPLFLENHVVGYGSECIVVDMDGKPTKVAALSYRDLDKTEAASLYYLQRVYSTLFPHNFPKFHAAFAYKDIDDETTLTGTIRQKIITGNHREIIYPFSQVQQICSEWGIPLEIEIHPYNIIIGVDGGQYYVDKPTKFNKYKSEGIWDVEKIREFMERFSYPKEAAEIVNNSLARLKKLRCIKTK